MAHLQTRPNSTLSRRERQLKKAYAEAVAAQRQAILTSKRQQGLALKLGFRIVDKKEKEERAAELLDRHSVKRSEPPAAVSGGSDVGVVDSALDASASPPLPKAARHGDDEASPPAPVQRDMEYTDDQRAYALAFMRKHGPRHATGPHAGKVNLAATAALLVSEKDWPASSTNYQMLQRFLQLEKTGRKDRGRPVNAEFEAAVRHRLLAEYTSEETGEYTVSTTAFKRRDVVAVARQLRDEDARFSSDETVLRLAFEACWFRGWCKRQRVARRLVTAKTKTTVDWLKSAEDMTVLQQRIQLLQHSGLGLINADETALFFKDAQPRQLTSTDVTRTSAAGYHDSSRMTLMLASASDGTTLPVMAIIKASAKGPDFTGMRVHRSTAMAVAELLGAGADFEEDVWERELLVRGRGGGAELVPMLFKIPYARLADGTIITANERAWMTQAFCCMWIDLVVAEHARKHSIPVGLVWDNCAAHRTSAVLATLQEQGITDLPLPPNTTSKYQVMDVVVNGPFKRFFWDARAKLSMTSFQQWREVNSAALAGNNETMRIWRELCAAKRRAREAVPPRPLLARVSEWRPPSISVAQGVVCMLSAVEGIRGAAISGAIQRCFIKLGLAARGDGRWVNCLHSTKAADAAMADPDDVDDQVPMGSMLGLGLVLPAPPSLEDIGLGALP